MEKKVKENYCNGCSRNYMYSTCRPSPDGKGYITLPDDCLKYKQEMEKYVTILEE